MGKTTASGDAQVPSEGTTNDDGQAEIFVSNTKAGTILLTATTGNGGKGTVEITVRNTVPKLTLVTFKGTPLLTWNEIEGATSYTVMRGTVSGQYEEIATNLTKTYYTDANLVPENTYYYVVVAVNDQGRSEKSNEVEFEYTDEDGDLLAAGVEKLLGTSPNNPDTDGDKILDSDEVIYCMTNPLEADTDGDGLTDKFEVDYHDGKLLNPTKKDSDENGISDSDEDLDGDGLTNQEEQEHKTNPHSSDTDGDGLEDGKELDTLKTNPSWVDTDNDELEDASELKFGTDPLNPDSDGNGIVDGKEKRQQTFAKPELHVSLAMKASGDLDKTTTIYENHEAMEAIGSNGVIGKPVEIATSSEFDEATLTFSYAVEQLGNTRESDLRVFYFNPENRMLELVSDQTIDTNNHQVSAKVTHVSTYVLADFSLWSKTWKDNLIKGGTSSETEQPIPLDLVLAIDNSGSTIGLGTSINQTLLRGIADATGGDFYLAKSAGDLFGLFDRVGEDLNVDSDSDGLPDWVEKKGYIVKGSLYEVLPPTDPNKADTDGDGLTDGQEIGSYYYDKDTRDVYVIPAPTEATEPKQPLPLPVGKRKG